jgi:hypothetical protein
MPISSVVKNFRDVTILINDGTSPTPLAMTVQYENGDFSLSGSNQGNYEHTKYLDRGELGSIRKTNRSFPTGSFTAQLTDLSDATNQTLWDAVNKTGWFASAVSTLGANADLFCLKLTLTIEGSNFGGGETDHVLVMNDCRCSIDVAEGDPDSFTLNFEVLGSITAT